jgi:hypothetical protein
MRQRKLQLFLIHKFVPFKSLFPFIQYAFSGKYILDLWSQTWFQVQGEDLETLQWQNEGDLHDSKLIQINYAIKNFLLLFKYVRQLSGYFIIIMPT